jgi:hypothetical protein
MARPTNTVGTTTMTVSVGPQIRQYLMDLTAKGTFGNTPQDVIRAFVLNAIQKLIADKQLDERRWRVLDDGSVELIPN